MIGGRRADLAPTGPLPTAKKDSDAQPCHLLQAPGVVRNRIYTLAFEGHELDLMHPRPLPNDLLLTCRQIHRETVTMYRQACAQSMKQGPYVIYTQQIRDGWGVIMDVVDALQSVYHKH